MDKDLSLVPLYERAPKVIADLLSLVELIKSEDIPATCGGCGTPAAQCDNYCMEAAHMASHNAKIHRATDWIKAVQTRKIKLLANHRKKYGRKD